jgi:crossover junction endodeoxyribonuclease RuvC
MKVLGIDPGSHITGYGILSSEDQTPHYIAHGLIKMRRNASLPERLGKVFNGIVTVMETYEPDVLAIEKVFFAKNPHSALMLGQARGVAMLPGILKGIEIHEYSALEIKQSVVGYGQATKQQVKEMVTRLLSIHEDLTFDGADALAVGICCLQHLQGGFYKRGVM